MSTPPYKPTCSITTANLLTKFARGGANHVLRTYLKLPRRAFGENVLWCMVERVAAGEGMDRVLADYGYTKGTGTQATHP